MKLQDELVLYEEVSVSDGAGGQIPSEPREVMTLWGNVKPMTGFIGMSFQQMAGTQGFEIIIRTDFDFPPGRKYMIGYQGIYGEHFMLIHSVQINKYYTKIIAKSENEPPDYMFLVDNDGKFITDESDVLIIL